MPYVGNMQLDFINIILVFSGFQSENHFTQIQQNEL